MPTATLVIYKSTDDCHTWDPVKTADVPDWLKDPEIVSHMVDGEAVINHDETDYLSATYYCAKRVLNEFDHGAILAAKAKRIRRAERNIRTVGEDCNTCGGMRGAVVGRCICSDIRVMH